MPRDPFDDDNNRDISDFFREIERMMEEMTGGNVDISVGRGVGDESSFGSDAHFSVHESGDEMLVVGDLPGIERDGIDVKCDGRYLTVAARSDHREYEERVELPARVDEHSATATFNNGVLEVTLERDDDATNVGLQ